MVGLLGRIQQISCKRQIGLLRELLPTMFQLNDNGDLSAIRKNSDPWL